MSDSARHVGRDNPGSDPQVLDVSREEIVAFEAIIDSWINASPEEQEEQKETGEYLRRALDEDRPSYRKLFE